MNETRFKNNLRFIAARKHYTRNYLYVPVFNDFPVSNQKAEISPIQK